MASVDGARPTDKPSDTVSNVKCDPCVHSGLVKEASAYCQQCEEHMCVECASMHKGFKQSRNHSITFGSDLPLAEQTSVKKLSLSYCAEHGDKAIEWFCEKDDVMFCDTCRRIQHRKCQVASVSDKKEFGHAQSLADAMDSLVSLNRRITKLKAERQNSTKYLEDVAYSCQLAVQQFKSTIIETVERLEKELLSDINKIVTTETAIIQDHVFTCDSLIPQVDTALTAADEAKTAADDVTSVIASHKLAKALNKFAPTVTDLEQEAYNVQIKFKPSGKLADVLRGTDQLGVLEVDRTERVGVDLPDTASDGVIPLSVRSSWSQLEVVSSIKHFLEQLTSQSCAIDAQRETLQQCLNESEMSRMTESDQNILRQMQYHNQDCMTNMGRSMQLIEHFRTIRQPVIDSFDHQVITDKENVPTKTSQLTDQKSQWTVYQQQRSEVKSTRRSDSYPSNAGWFSRKPRITVKAQLYCPRKGDLASAVVSEMSTMLRTQLNVESVLETVDQWSSIRPDVPVIVICINASRLGTDVASALQKLTVNKSMSLVVMHHKDIHSLPNQSSDRVLTAAKFKQLGGIFDMAFLSGIGIYPCEMNNGTVSAIVDFIRQHN